MGTEANPTTTSVTFERTIEFSSGKLLQGIYCVQYRHSVLTVTTCHKKFRLQYKLQLQ